MNKEVNKNIDKTNATKAYIKELQDKGVLSNCHVNVVQLIDTVAHTNYQEELKYLVTNKDRIDYIGKLLNTIFWKGLDRLGRDDGKIWPWEHSLSSLVNGV